ncbi:hypothetical protein QQ045_007117 [Rhodiola kirilowii]
MKTMYPKSYGNSLGNLNVNKYAGNNQHAKDLPNKYNNNDTDTSTSTNNSTDTLDRRFKTLPAAETPPKHETLGGYIFVCNNDTMQEDLKRQLFGLPPRY